MGDRMRIIIGGKTVLRGEADASGRVTETGTGRIIPATTSLANLTGGTSLSFRNAPQDLHIHRDSGEERISWRIDRDTVIRADSRVPSEMVTLGYLAVLLNSGSPLSDY